MKLAVKWGFITQTGTFLCLLVYALLIGGRSEAIASSPVVYYVNFGLTIVLSFFILYQLVTDKIKFFLNPLIITAVLFFLATAVSVILSENFWISISEYYYWCVYGIAFLALIAVRKMGWRPEWMQSGFLLLGSIFVIGQILFAFLEIWSISNFAQFDLSVVTRYRPNSPNLTAGIANIIIFIILGKLLRTKKHPSQILLILLLSLSMGVLFLSSSRGALIGTLGGAILMALVHFFSIYKKIQPSEKTPILLRPVTVVAVAGLIGGLLVIGALDTARTGIEGRYPFWNLAFSLVKQAPLWGAGLHTYPDYMPIINSIPPGILHNHAHSVAFTMIAEVGLVGLVLFLALIWLVISRYVSSYIQSGNFILLGYVGVIGSFLGHGLVDTLYVEPYYTVLLISSIAISIPLPRKENHNDTPQLKAVLLGCVLFVLVMGVFLTYTGYPYLAGATLADVRNTESISLLEKALQRAPNSALIQQQLGIRYSYLHEFEPPGETNELEKAIFYLERASELDPNWPANHTNLGALYAESGDLDLALSSLLRAYELAPKSKIILLNLAVIAELNGDKILAEQSYLEYIRLTKGFDFGPFWSESPVRNKIQFDHYVKLMKKEQETASRDEIIDFAEEHPRSQSARLQLGKLYLDERRISAAGNEIALAGIYSNHKSGLDDMELLWLRAKLNTMQGNYESGVKFAEEAFDGWRQQSIFGVGIRDLNLYGIKKYRLPVWEDDLVPSIITEPIPYPWIDRLLELGTWYLAMQEFDKAANVFDEILAIDANCKQAEDHLLSIQN